MKNKILTELKNTTWPTGRQLVNLTIYTLILCGIIALLVLVLDLAFFELRDWFLNI
jgi:preprotein translocase SecE subunit